MFRFSRRQQQRDPQRQRRLILVQYGEDCSVRNMVANQTIVEAIPVPESPRGGHNLNSTSHVAPRRRRRFFLCGGSGMDIEEGQHLPRPSSPRVHNLLPTAQVLDVVLVDPRSTVSSSRIEAERLVTLTTRSSMRDSAASRSSRGQSQSTSSFDGLERSRLDRLGVLPRSILPHDSQEFSEMLHRTMRGVDEYPPSTHGENQSHLTNLAEIIMMQGGLAIGIPEDEHEDRSTGSSLKLPHEDILPGVAETKLPDEVSYLTVPTSYSEPRRAVSEVTLPLELRGDQDIPDDDAEGDYDRYFRGSFTKEDYLDDKELEELVSDLQEIHNEQIVQIRRETKSRKSILRSITDPRTGKSLRSLASDSSELVNLMQEQYTALQLLEETQRSSAA